MLTVIAYCTLCCVCAQVGAGEPGLLVSCGRHHPCWAASVGGLVAPLVTSLSHSHTLTAVTDVSKDAAATKLQACYRGSRVRFTVLVLQNRAEHPV